MTKNSTCYVMNGFGPDRRQVEIGEFTDDFIEVKTGLKEGDRVLLHPPENTETEKLPRANQPPATKPKPPSTIATDPAKAGKT